MPFPLFCEPKATMPCYGLTFLATYLCEASFKACCEVLTQCLVSISRKKITKRNNRTLNISKVWRRKITRTCKVSQSPSSQPNILVLRKKMDKFDLSLLVHMLPPSYNNTYYVLAFCNYYMWAFFILIAFRVFHSFSIRTFAYQGKLLSSIPFSHYQVLDAMHNVPLVTWLSPTVLYLKGLWR